MKLSLQISKLVARKKDKEQTRRLGTGAPFRDKHDQIIVSPNGGRECNLNRRTKPIDSL